MTSVGVGMAASLRRLSKRIRGPLCRAQVVLVALALALGQLLGALSPVAAYADEGVTVTFSNGGTATMNPDGTITGVCSLHGVYNDDHEGKLVTLPDGTVQWATCNDEYEGFHDPSQHHRFPKNGDYTFTATPNGGGGYTIVVNSATTMADGSASDYDHDIVYVYPYMEFPVQNLRIELWEPELNGDLRLEKTSANPAITNGNACYSLAGAWYDVYSDSSLTNSVGLIVTAQDGTGSLTGLTAGTYYVRERTAPKGYALDDRTYTVNVEAGKTVANGQAATLRVSDVPQNDPVGMIAMKLDAETGGASPLGAGSLEGAEFTVRYYDNTDGRTTGTPKYEWVFRTDANGYARFQEGSKVSGPAIPTSSTGISTLPLGTVWVRESKAPEGYLLPEPNEPDVQVIRPDGQLELVSAFVEPTPETTAKYEPVKRGDLAFNKIDAAQQAVPRVAFSVTSVTTGESHIIVTDDNGQASTEASWSPHSDNTNANDAALRDDGTVDDALLDPDAGVWFTGTTEVETSPDDALGALPYDTYEVTELRSAANEGLSLVSFRVVVSRDGLTIDRGTVTDAASPQVHTTLTDADGNHVVPASGVVTLVDTVEYNDVTPGTEYTLYGELYDNATGESLGITSSATFTPTQPHGSTEVTFEVDTDALQGTALVAFEELFIGTTPVASHTDIEDEAQTVSIPEIATTLEDAEGAKEAPSVGMVTLVDTVDYKGLIPGQAYGLIGELYDKATGESLGVVAGGSFTPTESEGTAEVTFEVDGSILAGKSVVAFETLYLEGREVAVHADLEDEAQTVTVPKVGTTLTDEGGYHEALGQSGDTLTIVDTVDYEGVVPGASYTVEGELYDRATGESLGITASAQLVPEVSSGQAELTFEVAYDDVVGTSFVAFETLLDANGRVVAEHADLDDEGQTVRVPSGRTMLVDVTGSHEALADEPLVLVDTITYAGLIPGTTYTVTGTLMDKATGEPVEVDGKPVTATSELTPTEESGRAQVTFEVPGSVVAGKSVVAFETVTNDGRDVIVHADLDDEDQTVTVPKIGTTLAAEDGSKEVKATGTVKLVDTVSYENLIPGQEYMLSGILNDQKTGEALKDADGNAIHAEAKFTPEKASGTVEVTFEVDASLLAGKSVVAFETLTQDNRTVAVHADINDEAQTVTFPGIRTSLGTESGTKVVTTTGTVKLVDTVSYENLTPGKEYTVTGTLMDKATGQPLKDGSGKEVTATAKFKPSKATGTVKVTFQLNSTGLTGKTAVAFETLTRDGVEVAVHTDINDADQSVNFNPTAPTARTPQRTTQGGTTSKMPSTGGNSLVAPAFAIIGVAGLAWVAHEVVARRKREE